MRRRMNFKKVLEKLGRKMKDFIVGEGQRARNKTKKHKEEEKNLKELFETVTFLIKSKMRNKLFPIKLD